MVKSQTKKKKRQAYASGTLGQWCGCRCRSSMRRSLALRFCFDADLPQLRNDLAGELRGDPLYVVIG